MSAAKIILDTNIVSYLMKNDPIIHAYTSHIKGRLLAISFITVGELYFGVEKAMWGADRREKLETTLRNFVVIPYDHLIARRYGEIVAFRQKHGDPISINDAWIAACAVRHSVPLVTHNAKHFQNIPSLSIITEATTV